MLRGVFYKLSLNVYVDVFLYEFIFVFFYNVKRLSVNCLSQDINQLRGVDMDVGVRAYCNKFTLIIFA